MALTRELIQANDVISGLSDDQIAAIVTLSQNDESAVIAKKTGEIYGSLDADILNTSGIAKNGTEKTYDYAKRVIGEIRQKADGIGGLQSQVDALTKEKTRLEKVISDGGSDAETKKALKQAQTDLAAVTKDYTDLKSKFDSENEKHAKELFDMKIDGEFSRAASGLKFKSDFPTSVVDVVRKQAIEKVRGMFPEYVDDGNGGKTLVFKASDSGEILRNPENGLNPYTVDELLKRELSAMGVLDNGRKQQGSGGGDGGNGRKDLQTIDLSGAKTQNEAYEVIAKSLMERGMVNGSREFVDAMNKAWSDNNVKSLPR